MSETAAKPQASTEADFGQCEYVPFGAQDKIKLSFNLILKWLAVKTAKGASPSEQDVMKFLMTCKARKLNPFDGDSFLIGYDGKEGPVFSTIVAHQALLKRAETHPEFDGMESGVIVQIDKEVKELVGDFFPAGATLLGGWATVFFVNRKHPMKKKLKLSTFNRGFGVWKNNPEGMIVKCAEADALRSSFPQLIGGMYLREEMGVRADADVSRPPSQLEDRRADFVPARFGNGTGERSFVDSHGEPIMPGKSPRYEQDTRAAAVAELINPSRKGELASGGGAPNAESESSGLIYGEHSPVYLQLLEDCRSVRNPEDGAATRSKVNIFRANGDISEKEMFVLMDVINLKFTNVPKEDQS